MAGDWTKIRNDLAEDPAVLMISQETSLDPDMVVGKLFRFWVWTGAHTTTGKLPGVTVEMIDKVVHQEGFARAMQRAGWLDTGGKVITIPKWDRHNGRAAKKRLQDAQRQSRARSKGMKTPSAKKRDATVTRRRPREEQRTAQAAQSTSENKEAAQAAQNSSENHRGIQSVFADAQTESEVLMGGAAGCCKRRARTAPNALRAMFITRMIERATYRGRPIVDRAAAEHIAAHANATKAKVEWALQRLAEEEQAGKEFQNPGGWLRSMIENQKGPSEVTVASKMEELQSLRARQSAPAAESSGMAVQAING